MLMPRMMSMSVFMDLLMPMLVDRALEVDQVRDLEVEAEVVLVVNRS